MGLTTKRGSMMVNGPVMKRGSIMLNSLVMKRGSMMRRGSVSSNIVEINRYTEKHPECGKILKKIPLDRNTAEKTFLLKEFRDFKAFKKLSDFTLSEVVGSLVLQEYEANRAIFKQGTTITI